MANVPRLTQGELQPLEEEKDITAPVVPFETPVEEAAAPTITGGLLDAEDLVPVEEVGSFLRPPSSVLTQNAVRASEINPDQAASDKNLADKLGLPLTVIGEENREGFRKQATQNDIQNVPDTAPVTKRFLTTDDLVPILGSDDVPNLVGMERAAKQLTFTASFANGVDLLQSLNWRFVEAVGEATGIETLEELGEAGALANLAEITGPGKQEFLKIETAGDFFSWMKQTAGEQIPLMAPSLAGGLTGAAAGTLVAGPIGTLVGGTLGVFIPSFILGVGETQQAIKERSPTTEAPGVAFGAGALIGVLDSALPGRAGSALVRAFGQEAAETALKLTATNIMARSAKEGAKGLTLEGVTEAVQEAISETAAASATDTEVDVDELTRQMIEAFAAGAFLGGGVGTATSVTTDTLAKARQTKAAMDSLHDIKSKSKLVSRDPFKGAEMAAEDMRAAGVEEVFVPVDKLIEFANQRPEGIEETFRALGVEEDISEAIRNDADVRIDGTRYAEVILGQQGYAAMAADIKIKEGDKSFSQAAEDLVASIDQETLTAELDGVFASDEIKTQVEELLGKLTPGNAAEALDSAPRGVTAVLMDLINKVGERKVSVEADVREGRIAQLDEELSTIDRDIETAQEDLDTRVEEGRATVRAERRVERLTEQREQRLDEQEQLAFEERQIVQATTPEGQAVAEEIKAKKVARKPIKVKAKKLQDLGVKITTEAVRATRTAFRAGLKAGEALTTQKTDISKAINKLPLPVAAKKQLTDRISRVKTEAQLKKTAAAVQSKAAVLVEREQRKQIKSAVKKQLKDTAPRSVGGKLVGKFDADTQQVLDAARDIMSLSPEVAQERLDAALTEELPSPAKLFERKLLAVAANDPNLGITDAENVLFDIVAIKAGGAAAALERTSGRKNARNTAVAEAREAVTQGEPTKALKTTGFFNRLKSRAKDVNAAFASAHNGWDEVLDIIFNKRGADAESLIKSLRITDEIQDMKGLAIQWEQKTTEAGLTAFDLDGYSQLMSKHIDDAKRTDFGVFENSRGDEVRLEYSRAEIRKLWMESQDPTIADVITDDKGMAFSEAMLRVLFDTLTPQDQAYVDAQLAIYRSIYPTINATYRRVYGVNLPFNQFYSPIQRDKGDTPTDGSADSFGADRILTDEMEFRRQLPRSIKTRSDNLVPLLRRSDVGAMHRYLHDMAWFTKTTDRVLFMKSVFDSQPLRKDIKAQHGNAMVRTIDSFLQDFGTGYPAKGVVGEQVFGTFNRLFSSSVLSLKATIGTKQLVSWFAMAENVPTKDFISAHADFFKSPARAKQIVKFLYQNSPTLQQRGSSLDFELAKVGSLDEPVFRWKKQEKWEKIKFAFIHYGDRVPIYAGGWAVYKHAISQGKSKTEAIKVFQDALNSTQQSVDIDKLSSLQRSGPMGRTLTMFMTARFALLRGELRAFRQFRRGKISTRQFGKRMAMYHFIMPMFIQYIASGFEWEPDRQLIAATLGQLNSLVILGDILMYSATEAFTDRKGVAIKEIPMFDVLAEMAKGVNDAFEADDVEELTEALLEMAGMAGAITGQPVDQVGNILGGLNDVVEGDVEQGLKRIYGFSKKVAEESSR